MQPQLLSVEDGRMLRTGHQEQGFFGAPPCKAGGWGLSLQTPQQSGCGRSLEENVQCKYVHNVSSILNSFICLSRMAINILCLSYLQCVGDDFTGFTVCPPFFAFGKCKLYLSFPEVDLAWVRPAFSLKCIAARYSLKNKIGCNDKSLSYQYWLLPNQQHQIW